MPARKGKIRGTVRYDGLEEFARKFPAALEAGAEDVLAESVLALHEAAYDRAVALTPFRRNPSKRQQRRVSLRRFWRHGLGRTGKTAKHDEIEFLRRSPTIEEIKKVGAVSAINPQPTGQIIDEGTSRTKHASSQAPRGISRPTMEHVQAKAERLMKRAIRKVFG